MRKPEKLSKEIVNLLLPRLGDEFTAHYHYLAASNYCKGVGFFKAGAYFLNEAQDELKHAQGIQDFLVDWNIIPELPEIDKPIIAFSGLLDVIESSYNIEYKLYEDYEETSMKVFNAGDLCVFDFLQFYRTTQKTSVAEYSDMLNVLEGTKTDDKFQLLMIEEKLFS